MKCAIIGSGNIGTDLMIKLLKGPDVLELVAVVGIDAASEGLAMARERGVTTTHEGMEGLRKLPVYPEIGIVFDATSAYAHKDHDAALQQDGKLVVDLTPAALGPFFRAPGRKCARQQRPQREHGHLRRPGDHPDRCRRIPCGSGPLR